MRVKGLVHRRSRQVVHGGIDDAEVLLLAGLEVQHLGHADARIADQRAARFDHELAVAEAARVELARTACCHSASAAGGCVAVVVDAQAAAEVDVVQRNAGRLDRLHQVEDAVHARRGRAPSSVICEPMWQSMPTTFRPGSEAACR